jgi:DNA-binding NarL/FixJ family response regulator
MIRVLIVDDREVIRDGLRAALGGAADIEVVGEAASGEEALAVSEKTEPDVVFMDLRMPGMDGIEATRRIRQAHPETKVVIFTEDESRTKVNEAIQAGASGYLLKDGSVEELLTAARFAIEGKAVIDQRLTAQAIEELAERAPDEFFLSEREMEIFRTAASGVDSKKMAESLGISEKAVKKHLREILHKLSLRDRPSPPDVA